MDFTLVTDKVLGAFEERGVRYGLIGGYALGLWGATRATIDMDFLLLLEDLQVVERILSEFAYRRIFLSENVAQYVSDLAPFGQLDLILARRPASIKMLDRVGEIESGAGRVRVVQPEDLIGLKLQALVNDPRREAKEKVDMAALVEAKATRGEAVDWDLLGEYFRLFGKEAILDELKEGTRG